MAQEAVWGTSPNSTLWVVTRSKLAKLESGTLWKPSLGVHWIFPNVWFAIPLCHHCKTAQEDVLGWFFHTVSLVCHGTPLRHTRSLSGSFKHILFSCFITFYCHILLHLSGCFVVLERPNHWPKPGPVPHSYCLPLKYCLLLLLLGPSNSTCTIALLPQVLL